MGDENGESLRDIKQQKAVAVGAKRVEQTELYWPPNNCWAVRRDGNKIYIYIFGR